MGPKWQGERGGGAWPHQAPLDLAIVVTSVFFRPAKISFSLFLTTGTDAGSLGLVAAAASASFVAAVRTTPTTAQKKV